MGAAPTYYVMRTPDGYIATCDLNPKISVFLTDRSRVDDGIHKAAIFYADIFPDDPHRVLRDGTVRMRGRFL